MNRLCECVVEHVREKKNMCDSTLRQIRISALTLTGR